MRESIPNTGQKKAILTILRANLVNFMQFHPAVCWGESWTFTIEKSNMARPWLKYRLKTP